MPIPTHSFPFLQEKSVLIVSIRTSFKTTDRPHHDELQQLHALLDCIGGVLTDGTDQGFIQTINSGICLA